MKKSELETIAKRILPKQFGGVHSMDNLPQSLCNDSMHIIFRSTGTNGHW